MDNYSYLNRLDRPDMDSLKRSWTWLNIPSLSEEEMFLRNFSCHQIVEHSTVRNFYFKGTHVWYLDGLYHWYDGLPRFCTSYGDLAVLIIDSLPF